MVDTNVAVVADRGHERLSRPCGEECVKRLVELMASGTVLLDDRGRILTEYVGSIATTGQPSPGKAFVKWVQRVQRTARCERVTITPCGVDGHTDFTEFPRDEALADFDEDDRKFIAVACVAGSCEIWEAADSKWWGWHEALRAAGVEVTFLCPDELRDLHESKQR